MYGYHVRITAQPRRRDELVAVLLEGFEMLRWAGCRLYLVSTDPGDDDGIWVTQVWESRQQHDDAVRFDIARRVIAEASSLMVGDFDGTALTVIAAWGSSDSSAPLTVEDVASGRHLHSIG